MKGHFKLRHSELAINLGLEAGWQTKLLASHPNVPQLYLISLHYTVLFIFPECCYIMSSSLDESYITLKQISIYVFSNHEL